MNMKRIAFCLLIVCIHLPGASFRDDFAVVLIDAASEAKHGAFPLDRSIIARAVEKASDLVMAKALTNIPVILQARIDDTEAQPNPLPTRFMLGVKAETQVSGRSG